MKKIVIVSIIIYLTCVAENSFSQNILSAKSGDEKKITPKGNTLIVKKKSNLINSMVKGRTLPGNSEKYRKENSVPDNFPRYNDTGNPKHDADRYYQAKQEWIKTYPEEFKKIKHLTF